MVLTVAVLVQAVMAFAVFAPMVLAPVILRSLDLPPIWAGFYAPFAFSCAIVGSLGAGRLIGFVGPWRLSFACVALASAGLGVIGFGMHATLALGAMLIGFGYGPITAAGSIILMQSAASNLGLRMSARQAGVPLGWSAAGFLLPPLVGAFGWSGSCAILAMAGVGLAALLAIVCPFARGERVNAPSPTKGRARGLLHHTLSHPRLLSTALVTLCFASVQSCFSSFASVYLVDALRIELGTAGMLLGTAFGIGILARVFWGAMADRLGTVLVLGVLGGTMSLALILTGRLAEGAPMTALVATIGLFGFTGTGWNGIVMARGARLSPPGFVGQVAGEISVFAYAGFIIAPPLFSLLARAVDMHAAFVALGLACAAATAFFLLAERQRTGS
jgi:MFS family permease